jgi:predicted metalloprotease
MKYDPNYQSDDVEDRRRQGGGASGLVGILLQILLRTRYGWILVILLFVGYFAAQQLGLLGPRATAPGRGAATSSLPAGDDEAHFAAFVLDDAQKFWAGDFAEQGRQYRNAKLVLFTDQTPTACGYGAAATGPFYCGADEKVYIDLGFFRVLGGQLGAKGQFARAYVIAHEIGHHVQKLLGTSAKGARGQVVGESGASVRLELQADCYAGVWASSAGRRGLLERGDIESALTAASRIGDDVLQREETGRVRPEKFTHGTAAQRYRWLERGYDSGSMKDCDTFATDAL